MLFLGAVSLLQPVLSKHKCAPSTGANLWGASPLWENRNELIEIIVTTSRWQGLAREGWSGGSLSANVRDDEQKLHIRLVALWRAGT